MQALVLAEVGRFELVDLPDPSPGPGEALIRVSQSGICGSELGGFQGTDGLRRPGLVFGHELIGVLEAYGPGTAADDHPSPGGTVTVNPLRSCGHCRVCLAGRPNVCPTRSLLGGHEQGSNAEYVVVPAGALHRVADATSSSAVLAEPAACALRAVRRSSLGPGGSALVLGAGPIGLLLLEMLRHHGVQMLFFTERMNGRAPAAEASGAVRLSDDDEELIASVLARTDGFGVDAVFDAVGSRSTRRSAVRAVRPGGDVCFVGLHASDTVLPIRDLIRREVACLTTFAYTPADFADAISLLETGAITFHGDIVHDGLAAGQLWYERLIAGHPAGKVVLEPGSPAGPTVGAAA